MKKRIVSLFCCLITVCSMGGSAMAASPEQYEIDSVDELKSALNNCNRDGKISLIEKNKLSNETKPDVVAELCFEKLEIALNEFEAMEIVLVEDGNGDEFAEVTIELGDGCYAIVELSDEAEMSTIKNAVQNVAAFISPVAYAKSEQVTKEYGNRYFTAGFNVVCGVGTARIVLENHYNLSASGITERYGVSSCWTVNLGGEIEKYEPVITDYYATKPGESDTNMYCQYKSSSSAEGVLNASAIFTINTRLIYDDIDTTNKTITLTHVWTKSS